MKKICILISAIFFSSTSFYSQAQTWGTTTTPTYTSGNVGIGSTSAPTNTRLYIYNDATVYPPGPGVTTPVPEVQINRYYMATIPTTIPNIFEVWYHPLYPAGSAARLADVIDPSGNLGINQATPSAPLDVNGNALIENSLTVNQSLSTGTTAAVGLSLTVGTTASVSQSLTVGTNAIIGQVLTVKNAAVIGTPTSGTLTTPGLGTSYSLYVTKGILTEKVKVALTTTANWSDFVFNKNYDLMPIYSVENYINVNKHLPEIPSAQQVVNDGIDVANMDAKLLQKIEELTLYIIQQQKQIDNQQAEIEKMKK